MAERVPIDPDVIRLTSILQRIARLITEWNDRELAADEAVYFIKGVLTDEEFYPLNESEPTP